MSQKLEDTLFRPRVLSDPLDLLMTAALQHTGGDDSFDNTYYESDDSDASCENACDAYEKVSDALSRLVSATERCDSSPKKSSIAKHYESFRYEEEGSNDEEVGASPVKQSGRNKLTAIPRSANSNRRNCGRMLSKGRPTKRAVKDPQHKHPISRAVPPKHAPSETASHGGWKRREVKAGVYPPQFVKLQCPTTAHATWRIVGALSSTLFMPVSAPHDSSSKRTSARHQQATMRPTRTSAIADSTNVAGHKRTRSALSSMESCAVLSPSTDVADVSPVSAAKRLQYVNSDEATVIAGSFSDNETANTSPTTQLPSTRRLSQCTL